MTRLVIAAVKVTDRHRTDLGDIAGLAESMREVGQLQPIVVTAEHRLVAGERRLAAARSLGWDEVEAKVVSNLAGAAALLRAERDENTCRKDFAPTEEHALYEALLALEKPKAEERMTLGKVSQGSSGRAKQQAAEAATGKPGRHKTLDKVGEVKEVVADEAQPEPIREVAKQALAEMDDSGKVDGAYQSFKAASRHEQRVLSLKEKAAQAVTEFSDLAYYADNGDLATVLRLADALRGYTEPELSVRLEALRRSIEADKREPDQAPAQSESEPDYYELTSRIFAACNKAARVAHLNGGAATVRAALSIADPLEISNWRSQFADLARTCQSLADACRPELRSIK